MKKTFKVHKKPRIIKGYNAFRWNRDHFIWMLDYYPGMRVAWLMVRLIQSVHKRSFPEPDFNDWIHEKGRFTEFVNAPEVAVLSLHLFWNKFVIQVAI